MSERAELGPVRGDDAVLGAGVVGGTLRVVWVGPAAVTDLTVTVGRALEAGGVAEAEASAVGPVAAVVGAVDTFDVGGRTGLVVVGGVVARVVVGAELAVVDGVVVEGIVVPSPPRRR